MNMLPDGTAVRLSCKTDFMVPMATNGVLEISRDQNYQCILLQNAGNTNIIINDRWTLFPQGTYGTGTTDNLDIQELKFNVVFDETVAVSPVNRLEISVSRVSFCDCEKVVVCPI